MPASLELGAGALRLEDVARGERIYGVNTGVGGNIGISLAPEQMEQMQANLVRHLACGAGQPLRRDVVRAATLLRVATFFPGTSAIRLETVEALAELLNRGIAPVAPRYGSVGASGDLMPSAYIARVLAGMGEAEFQGRRMSAEEALRSAGMQPLRFAPKEALALINRTTLMAAVAALLWVDARAVLRALLGAVALSVEALEAPDLPFDAWVQERKGHPGQIAVAASCANCWPGQSTSRHPAGSPVSPCDACPRAWDRRGTRWRKAARWWSARSIRPMTTR